ncbi:transcription factor PCF2-like [Musa acuminata AAA Group]|uniref:transcription factor PCF2-like n=1 Tax=Musa acuminata AAA Group TaxID=214697 RepID=UPI0031DB4A39
MTYVSSPLSVALFAAGLAEKIDVGMAAEVSSLATTLGAYEDEAEGESELVTRDLLGGGGGGGAGGGGGGGAGDVDLQLHVPAGWPTRIDLPSGKTSLEQRDPDPAPRHLHDLNLSPPSPSVASLALELASPSAEYQSVCTLEKVKSALERESRLVATTGPASPPPSSTTTTTSSSSSSSAVSTKRRAPTSPDEDGAAGSTMAVATCPVCLLYVLVSKAEPRCPRCAAHVPVNDLLKKKPRIDLNSSLPSH